MHEKCLNDQSLFERILIYVYLNFFTGWSYTYYDTEPSDYTQTGTDNS